MIAIGSSDAAEAITWAPAGTSAPRSSPSRNSVSASGLGWSNTIVVGSVRPVAAASLLRRSTAVIESKPTSRNALCSVSASAEAMPSTDAASARTSSSSCCSRSAGGRVRNWAANEPSDVVVCSAATVRARTSGSSSKSVVGRIAVKTGW